MQAFEATNYFFEQGRIASTCRKNVPTLMITPDREVRVEVVIELDSGTSATSSAIACSMIMPAALSRGGFVTIERSTWG